MITYKLKSAALAFVISFGLSAVTLIATSVPAHAATPAQANTRTVFTGDLDLTTARGQIALQARIRRAAEKLCVEPSERTLTTRQLGRNCIAATIASAAPEVQIAIQRDLAARQSANLAFSSQP